MTNYNDGNWHGWNGGECPVHPETVVECYAIDSCSPIIRKAGELSWSKNTIAPVIIVFRVVKEHREPREWWSLWSPAGNLQGNFTEEAARRYNETHFKGKGKVVHLREVLDD